MMKFFTQLQLLGLGLLSVVHAQEDATSLFGGSENDGYLSWLENESGGQMYEKSIFLTGASGSEDNQGVAFHWTILSSMEEGEMDTIDLALVVRARGWVGFGIAEAGGMAGADVLLYNVASEEVQDAYFMNDRIPRVDDCQDWKLVKSEVTDDGFLIVQASRRLDTGDMQDRRIHDDSAMDVPPSRVIFAWGDDQGGPIYHGNNRAQSSLRFFGETLDEETLVRETLIEQSTGYFDVTAKDYPVKAQETEYPRFCFSEQDLFDQGVPADVELHVIGFQAIETPGNEEYLHHYVVYASNEPFNDEIDNLNCGSAVHIEPVYAWTPGDRGLVLPKNVGVPLGEISNGFRSYMIETHYNNPNLDEGVIDSSGIRIYYSTETREHDMGVLSLGDAALKQLGNRVGDDGPEKFYEYAYECPSSCSSLAVTRPVTVLREYLHMHKQGSRMYQEVIRDGTAVRRSNIDFFQYDQSGNQVVQQDPYELLPGDGFKTVCYFEPKNDTIFGLSTQDEMCNSFVYYYPKMYLFNAYPWSCFMGANSGTTFTSCDAAPSKRAISDTQMERMFGTSSAAPDGSCPSSKDDSSAAVVFTWASLTIVSLTFVGLLYY
eukprot:scaffold2770_cov104-Cylindrotheca_fusiformis.AAC.3